MVETSLIITIIIVAVVCLGLLGFVIGTFATQTVFYTNTYVRPPLKNGIQPNGPARQLTQEEIDKRKAVLNAP